MVFLDQFRCDLNVLTYNRLRFQKVDTKKHEMYSNENEHVGEQLLGDQRKRARKENMAEETAEEAEVCD